jgi:putative cell wall-binding protein
MLGSFAHSKEMDVLQKSFSLLMAVILFFSCFVFSASAESSVKVDVEAVKNDLSKLSDVSLPEKEIDSSRLSILKNKMQTPAGEAVRMGEVYEVEPNDYFNLANHIMLDDLVVGLFDWYEDIDLYRFTISETQDLYLVGTTLSTLNDLGFGLVTPDGTVLSPDDGFVDDSDKLFAYYSMPPGVYYVAAIDLEQYGDGGIYGLTVFSGEGVPGDEEKSIFRISGEDRHETAIEISKAGWPDGADTVVLARDSTFPDALAGAPLAYHRDAPILLNPKDKLHQGVMARIMELGAKDVIILGGEGAISANVQKQLEASGLIVTRIGGKTRYETAALIAAELGDYEEAVIAYGGNFPDALSIAPYAAFNRVPILLTPKDELVTATQGALKNVTNTIIVGGKAAISSHVEKQLEGKNPYRISGSDRYETSVKLASQLGMQGEMITVATGENFADALTGSVLAAKYYEPIILVQKNNVPDPVKSYIKANGTWYYTILGGKAAVSDSVIGQLYDL